MQDPTTLFPVQTPIGKKVFAAFDTGELTTDSGIAFIRSVDDQLGLTASLAPLLPDPRNPLLVHHQHLDLLRQRIYSIVAGYEDTNDATKLRSDPALKMAAGRTPFDSRSDLASQPSLCRFEHRITAQSLSLMQMTYFENWLAHRARPKKMLLDMDSTWDETHGAQQLTFFKALFALVVDRQGGGQHVAGIDAGGLAVEHPTPSEVVREVAGGHPTETLHPPLQAAVIGVDILDVKHALLDAVPGLGVDGMVCNALGLRDLLVRPMPIGA